MRRSGSVRELCGRLPARVRAGAVPPWGRAQHRGRGLSRPFTPGGGPCGGCWSSGRSSSRRCAVRRRLVEFGRQREAAELAVAGLTGVRNVKHEIEISYDADPVDVTGLVQDALDRNALVQDDSDVRIDTSGNTVTLGGHVRSWAEHDAVVGATWMAPGVLQVRDYLDVTG
jgi:osmotically-inducible protein OsmY